MGEAFEYGQYAKVPRKLLEPIGGITKASIYEGEQKLFEQKLLKKFLYNEARQKIDYYDKKIAEMKQKYNMDFSAFQNKIYLSAAEVDLEEWNDFVLWGGYIKAYKYWVQFC